MTMPTRLSVLERLVSKRTCAACADFTVELPDDIENPAFDEGLTFLENLETHCRVCRQPVNVVINIGGPDGGPVTIPVSDLRDLAESVWTNFVTSS